MRVVKGIGKAIGVILLIPVAYLLIAYVLTKIPVAGEASSEPLDHWVYLHSNGVHLDIALSREVMTDALLAELDMSSKTGYFSFGWGERNFYLHTPTWADLTVNNAVQALFMNSASLVHLTRYDRAGNDWLEVRMTHEQMQRLNAYILNSFDQTTDGKKIILPGLGYSANDDFYEGVGSYSAFNTCNSWCNDAFKASGIAACLWTPYDFGLLDRHSSAE